MGVARALLQAKHWSEFRSAVGYYGRHKLFRRDEDRVIYELHKAKWKGELNGIVNMRYTAHPRVSHFKQWEGGRESPTVYE